MTQPANASLQTTRRSFTGLSKEPAAKASWDGKFVLFLKDGQKTDGGVVRAMVRGPSYARFFVKGKLIGYGSALSPTLVKDKKKEGNSPSFLV